MSCNPGSRKVKKILEMGVGRNPLAFTTWFWEWTGPDALKGFSRMLPPDVHYHAVDYTDDYPLLEEYRRIKGHIPNITISVMDARKLRFHSGFFDEVHMHYVMTDPSVRPEDMGQMLRETFRVLKKEGALIASGERFRKRELIDMHKGKILDFHKIADDSLRQEGFVVDWTVNGLEKASELKDLVMALLNERRYTFNRDRSGINPEAFVVVGWKP